MLRLVAVLAVGAVGSASAQLAVTEPTEKLLVLPLAVSSAADSATSIAVTDAARERLNSLARYKVMLVSKSKMCEALAASGFPCDGLMDARQAEQLARFLSVNSWTMGTLSHNSSLLTAAIHVVSGGSGFASTFTVTGGPIGSPQPLSEAIAQKLNSIIRAAEYARSCNEQRGRSNFQKALDDARRGLAIEPNLAALQLCVASVYEAERLGPDSIIAAALRAQKGDSLNGAAINLEANAWLQKGDTLRWLDALIKLTRSDIHNMNTAIGVGTLFLTHKQYAKGVALMNEVLAANPGNQQAHDLKKRLCIEGELWRPLLEMLRADARADTALLADTVTLPLAIGAAEKISDTLAYLFWTGTAVQHYPRSKAYLKARAAAWQLAGKPDSAITTEIRALQIDPSDMNLSLLIAQTFVDNASYDTMAVKSCHGDTSCVRPIRDRFVQRLDTAKTYLERVVASTDTVARVNAAALMRTAGEKLVRAAAADAAYQWLDRTLQVLAPRTPADTIGVRQAIRVNASFWFGLASTRGLSPAYTAMTRTKNCDQAKAFNDRLQRTREALQLGRSVHPTTVDNLLNNVLPRFDGPMRSVKASFKCRNF